MTDVGKDIQKEESEVVDELQVYELGYHLLSNLSEESLVEHVADIKSVIEKNGGLFIGEEGIPKEIHLTYTMQKAINNKKENFDTAYFGWIKFEASPESVKDIDQALEKKEEILRLILIKSVRESKMIARRPMPTQRVPETPKVSKPESEKDKGPISEKQVDEAIDELVVE